MESSKPSDIKAAVTLGFVEWVSVLDALLLSRNDCAKAARAAEKAADKVDEANRARVQRENTEHFDGIISTVLGSLQAQGVDVAHELFDRYRHPVP